MLLRNTLTVWLQKKDTFHQKRDGGICKYRMYVHALLGCVFVPVRVNVGLDCAGWKRLSLLSGLWTLTPLNTCASELWCLHTHLPRGPRWGWSKGLPLALRHEGRFTHCAFSGGSEVKRPAKSLFYWDTPCDCRHDHSYRITRLNHALNPDTHIICGFTQRLHMTW